MDDRKKNRRIDILEFIGSGASTAGEPQATLEAFLSHADAWPSYVFNRSAVEYQSPRQDGGFADE
ncbi:hypothetical protein [Rhizobium sp. R693]|uniref:hypothetical protein n=1 Tax=Rhizobium sp. R693 TaxID=1764276 RepID=UPI000B52D9E6|nr:hypothetical protein [Rhizobium sp. R693]OWV84633.1 hypothetical protein ATY79_12035 [Rhizobium sp. R693]